MSASTVIQHCCVCCLITVIAPEVKAQMWLRSFCQNKGSPPDIIAVIVVVVVVVIVVVIDSTEVAAAALSSLHPLYPIGSFTC